MTERRPSLDGVRTVAVYLVVLFHAGLPGFSGGFVGVDVFFVLSGFLITNVLLDDVDRFGRIRFGEFYSRRVRRLLPAAVVVVAATSVAFLLVAGIVERMPFVRDGQSALLYVANWRFLAEQNDYFATGVTRSPFLHFWSLAVEEQFYVVFPLLLLVLTRARRRRWLAPSVVALLFVLSLAAQVHLASSDPNHAYYGTDARAYQLLAGVLLAMLLRSRRQPALGVASGAATTGLAVMVLAATSAWSASPSSRGIVAVAAAVLLTGGLAVSDRGAVPRWLGAPTPAYLGRISYGTYLWHWPVIMVLAHVGVVSAPLVAVIAVALATALAAASYHVLELPVRRVRLTPRLLWPTVAAGVTVCAVVATTLVPPVMGSNRRPAVVTAAVQRPALPAPLRTIAAARTAAAGRHRVQVPRNLDWARLAQDYGPERTCAASDPQRCIAVQGHGLHILLVGDSHGRMLAPALIALAHEHGFTLSLNVIPSCPWQAQLSNLSQPPANQARCTAARDVWYRTVLPKLHPDVVVLATYARDNPAVYANTLKRTGGSHETLHELIRNTTNETVARIRATGAKVLIMRSVIVAQFDPLNCLSSARYVDQCRVPVPRAPVSDSYYLSAARRQPGVFTFTLNPIVCPAAPLCDAMVDGINVWRNPNHYSTRILVHFRDAIWAAMTRTHAVPAWSNTPRGG